MTAGSTVVRPDPAASASERTEPAWPAVTVVVPTHGRPQLLARTLRGILEQAYQGPIECLVVFDQQEPYPLDATVPPGRTLRALVNERTPGPAGARNTGATAATGDLVAFCDDDDEWLPDKLREQVVALRSDPAGFVATCGIVLESGGRSRVRMPEVDRIDLDDLIRSRRAEIHTSTLLVSRDALMDGVGLIDESIPGSYGEEYDWLLRAARRSPILVVRRPLVRVSWNASYFTERWDTIVEAITHQLEARPELSQDRANLARLTGRVAFAHAAMGHRAEATAWARRSLRADWRQGRGYLALLVAHGILRPQTVLRVAHRFGKGV